MHCNRSYIYSTNHSHVNEFKPEIFNQDRSTPVWIPTLDLAGLELDCDNDKEPEEIGTATPKNTTPESAKDGGHVLFVKKPKPSFVFPSESSFAHLEQLKNRHQLRYDDDANIVSVGSYRNGDTTVNSVPASRQTAICDQSQNDDKIISFSLRDHNLERYLRFDYRDLEVLSHQEKADKAIEPERALEKQEKQKFQESRPSHGKEKTKGAKSNDEKGHIENNQSVYEVIVVNGHLKSDVAGSHQGEDDPKAEEVYREDIVDSEMAKGKSKPRVTFSFEENRTPRGSIKRYTPLKGEMTFQLQGVLKKRPPPCNISSYSSSSHATNKQEKIRNSRNYKESSNYHLNYQDGLRLGLEHGIPVKHVHTTNTDLEKKQSRISVTATDIVQKPPVPTSTRITLSMAAAEKAAIGNLGRRTLSKSQNYSSAHTRGRMAYFRPAEGGRPPSGSGTGIRSRSTEDIRYHESKRLPSDCSSKSSKSRSLPFGLRRCTSSDQDLLVGNKQKPPKPKIAFGSFILPKEPVSHPRNHQIKFQDTERKPASQGTYVHAHTRRSPYAAPAQLFLKENQKSEIQQRPVTANQIRQLPQQVSPAKEVAHRHSAPSSYGQSREKSNVRLTINTSPTRAQGLKAAKSLTPNVPSQSYLIRTMLPSGAQVSRVRKTADFEQPNRQHIAAMNMISRRDKGVSHHRFVTKLRDYCNDVS